MFFMLILTSCCNPPDDWKFIDDAKWNGRNVLTFRTVELAEKPARPLHTDDPAPAGAKFGSVGLGPKGRQRLNLVWHAKTNTLWFDANGDGRYALNERHVMGDKPIEAKVPIAFDDQTKYERTVMIRQRGEGLAWAVRGYCTGNIIVEGKAISAVLTDSDADGCFDGAGSDRIWLDLDGNGQFDPLTEQFPLGAAIAVNGKNVLVQPKPNGLSVQARVRSSESGTLRVDVSRMPKAEVFELSANFVSEFGELIVVKEIDKTLPLPAGKYRVDSIRLRLTDTGGRVWLYQFSSGNRKPDFEIKKDQLTNYKLLQDLKVNVSVDGVAVPGSSVQIQPDVTSGGLYLTRCEIGDKHSDYGREQGATIVLMESGSIVLDQYQSGFL